MRKLVALATCIAASCGFAVEWANMLGQGYPALEAAWRLLFYFTILTNLLLVIVFGMEAIGSRSRPWLVAGATAAIALVGVVYWAMLEGVADLDGASPLGNYLLHKVTPFMALAYWLVLVRKGTLAWRDPIVWALYPLAYLAYALVRGDFEGRYPYPFLDLQLHGWNGVAITTGIIFLGFVAGGMLLVMVDRALSQG